MDSSDATRPPSIHVTHFITSLKVGDAETRGHGVVAGTELPAAELLTQLEPC